MIEKFLDFSLNLKTYSLYGTISWPMILLKFVKCISQMMDVIRSQYIYEDKNYPKPSVSTNRVINSLVTNILHATRLVPILLQLLMEEYSIFKVLTSQHKITSQLDTEDTLGQEILKNQSQEMQLLCRFHHTTDLEMKLTLLVMCMI